MGESFADRLQNWILDLPSGATTFSDKTVLLAGAYNLTQAAPQPQIDVTFVGQLLPLAPGLAPA